MPGINYGWNYFVNRAFISLYFFLVSSIVLIGWGLNHVWNSLAPENELHSDEIKTLFYWVERSIQQDPDQFLPGSTQTPGIKVDIIPLDEVAGDQVLLQLQQGEIFAASNDQEWLWYKLMPQTDKVILLSKNIEQEPLLYKVLLAAFYLTLALVIYIWVWPLSRDAKKLELQTQSLGPDKLPEELHLPKSSTLFPLAKSFNQMLHRLRELIASYKDMTNAVSHELRTPLARMKFALALIDENKLDAHTRQQLSSLSLDISEMESLINTLLLYAGFEQQQQQLKLTPGPVINLLDSLEKNFRKTHSSDLQLIIEDSTQGQDFYCEWKLLETVLQNLVNNAARYAKTTISIKSSINQDLYKICVEDDGPGIPETERERVFDSFVRLYDEPKQSGFGLGLAIVKRIMQWHQGGVTIEAAPELGGARLVLHWNRINN
jgi:two-component system OmpR family sensor kinase